MRLTLRTCRGLSAGGAVLSALVVVAVAALTPSLGGGRDVLPTVGAGAAPTAPAARDDLGAVVKRCLKGLTATPVPGLVGMTELQAFPPNVDHSTRLLAENGACFGDRLLDENITDLVLEEGRVVWAGRVTAPQDASGKVLPVPPQTPTGAELCRDSPDGTECKDLVHHQASALAAALATGQSAADAGECAATPAWLYRITWLPRTGSTVWTVPSAPCLHMAAAGVKYDLDQEAHDLVDRTWDEAS